MGVAVIRYIRRKPPLTPKLRKPKNSSLQHPYGEDFINIRKLRRKLIHTYRKRNKSAPNKAKGQLALESQSVYRGLSNFPADYDYETMGYYFDKDRADSDTIKDTKDIGDHRQYNWDRSYGSTSGHGGGYCACSGKSGGFFGLGQDELLGLAALASVIIFQIFTALNSMTRKRAYRNHFHDNLYHLDHFIIAGRR